MCSWHATSESALTARRAGQVVYCFAGHSRNFMEQYTPKPVFLYRENRNQRFASLCVTAGRWLEGGTMNAPDAASLDTCAVCIEDFNRLTAQGDIGNLPCNHAYHVECIQTWFKTKNVCPQCKQEVFEMTILGDGGRPIEIVVVEVRNTLQDWDATLEIDQAVEAAVCLACGSDAHEETLLLCDANCGNAMHTLCDQLASVPHGEWYCPDCRGANFYTLSTLPRTRTRSIPTRSRRSIPQQPDVEALWEDSASSDSDVVEVSPEPARRVLRQMRRSFASHTQDTREASSSSHTLRPSALQLAVLRQRLRPQASHLLAAAAPSPLAPSSTTNHIRSRRLVRTNRLAAPVVRRPAVPPSDSQQATAPIPALMRIPRSTSQGGAPRSNNSASRAIPLSGTPQSSDSASHAIPRSGTRKTTISGSDQQSTANVLRPTPTMPLLHRGLPRRNPQTDASTGNPNSSPAATSRGGNAIPRVRCNEITSSLATLTAPDPAAVQLTSRQARLLVQRCEAAVEGDAQSRLATMRSMLDVIYKKTGLTRHQHPVIAATPTSAASDARSSPTATVQSDSTRRMLVMTGLIPPLLSWVRAPPPDTPLQTLVDTVRVLEYLPLQHARAAERKDVITFAQSVQRQDLQLHPRMRNPAIRQLARSITSKAGALENATSHAPHHISSDGHMSHRRHTDSGNPSHHSRSIDRGDTLRHSPKIDSHLRHRQATDRSTSDNRYNRGDSPRSQSRAYRPTPTPAASRASSASTHAPGSRERKVEILPQYSSNADSHADSKPGRKINQLPSSPVRRPLRRPAPINVMAGVIGFAQRTLQGTVLQSRSAPGLQQSDSASDVVINKSLDASPAKSIRPKNTAPIRLVSRAARSAASNSSSAAATRRWQSHRPQTPATPTMDGGPPPIPPAGMLESQSASEPSPAHQVGGSEPGATSATDLRAEPSTSCINLTDLSSHNSINLAGVHSEVRNRSPKAASSGSNNSSDDEAADISSSIQQDGMTQHGSLHDAPTARRQVTLSSRLLSLRADSLALASKQPQDWDGHRTGRIRHHRNHKPNKRRRNNSRYHKSKRHHR